MMRLLIAACLISMLTFVSPAAAVVEVAETALATSVKDLKPSGVSEVFPATVGKVFCLSRIKTDEATTINHNWFYEDTLIGEVTLNVRPPSFGTYSSKNIHPSWTGSWRVEITAKDGTVLKTVHFRVE